MEGVLKPKDICDILQIDRMTMYKLINKGLLKAIDLNKGATQRPRYRIKKGSLNNFIEQQSITPPLKKGITLQA